MTDRTAEIVIVGAARTPMGAFQGELAPLAAPELGGAAIAIELADDHTQRLRAHSIGRRMAIGADRAREAQIHQRLSPRELHHAR
mgnify:CR=1 FL=1